jgi:hypothetical protein
MVSLPAFAAAALDAVRPEDVAADALVFPPTRGARLSVNREWNHVREAAGLPTDLVLRVTPHSTMAGVLGGALSGVDCSPLFELKHRADRLRSAARQEAV